MRPVATLTVAALAILSATPLRAEPAAGQSVTEDERAARVLTRIEEAYLGRYRSHPRGQGPKALANRSYRITVASVLGQREINAKEAAERVKSSQAVTLTPMKNELYYETTQAGIQDFSFPEAGEDETYKKHAVTVTSPKELKTWMKCTGNPYMRQNPHWSSPLGSKGTPAMRAQTMKSSSPAINLARATSVAQTGGRT